MKPHNLMLDDNWNIKLIDFGDSKDLDSKEDNPQILEEQEAEDFYEKQGNFKSLDQGRRGTLVGTINYLSPEMIKE